MTTIPPNSNDDSTSFPGGDVLLLIGHGSQDVAAAVEYYQFADRVAAYLHLPVYPGFLELTDPPLEAGIRASVAAGTRRVIALPLFLGAAGHQKNDVPAILNKAKMQWPQVDFKYGAPLGGQAQIISVLAQRAEEAIVASPAAISAAETALLLVGRGSSDPDSNSEVYKTARLLWEGREYGWVEAAFCSLTPPNLSAGLDRCVRLGARRIVVLPYLLFTGIIRQRIGDQARAAQAEYPGVEILVADHLGVHPQVVEALANRYQQVIEGTTRMNCDVCKYRQRLAGFEDEYGLPQIADHQHELDGGSDYEQAIETLLPPRYQNGQKASTVPMNAASLKYSAEGQVAWDQIWTDFCDLALAGGPSHRGELLEPVSPESVAADPAGYNRVFAELERGLRLVTGLPVVPAKSPGWIGLVCDNEKMALWLLRAIVVENVCVRREGPTLFLPAGPDFRLEYEIKNVITVIAKTCHYWSEHVKATGGQASSAGS